MRKTKRANSDVLLFDLLWTRHDNKTTTIMDDDEDNVDDDADYITTSLAADKSNYKCDWLTKLLTCWGR